ncbi:DUF1073 domain-containing protein [Helicobacter ganmani]|uniref:phage portal protein n=1 Tax=Helicobacter ganmani TaxID=60246 RepID=UPI003A87889E
MSFYPTSPKAKGTNRRIVYATQIQDREIDLSPLSNYQNEKEYTKFLDSFYNAKAGVNTGNSIMQFSQFLLQRLNYQECSTLSIEPIINNAIGKLSNEVFRTGYNILCENEELKEFLKKRSKELELDKKLVESFECALIYGGCLIYRDRDLKENLGIPLHLSKEIAKKNPMRALNIIPPYLVGASNVEMFNPLDRGYMKPSLWNISGNSNIHSSRLIRLVIFRAPDLILPMFNFFGISLCQLMKESVRNTNTAYNAIADILLRFKTDIITSDLLKINPSEAIARAEFINKSKNNLGTLLLTKDEVMQQFVTSIAGLDKVVAQLQESVAIAARMPAVKLLGLTPSGFNATGDYDLNSFYDELESMQKSIIEPILLSIYRELALEFDSILESEISIEFNPLKEKNVSQDATALNLVLDSCLKGIEAGIITQEQALSIVKDNGFWANVDFEKENANLGEFEPLDFENEKEI